MLKNAKVKAMLFVLVLIALLFTTGDFGLVGSEKMGIVSAIGIDKVEADYLVTTQIATAEGVDTKSGSQKILTQKSGTILGAINSLQESTGWTMNLNFLNLIVLGESVVSDSVYNALEFFIRGESSLPNVTLAVTKNASEVMRAETVLDKISAIALHKNLNAYGDKINSIAKLNLKDYFINYSSLSKSNTLPFVEVETQSEGGENKNSFLLNKSVVLNGDKSAGVLEEKENRILNIIEDKKALGFYTLSSEEHNYNFKILSKKIVKKIDIVDGEVVLKLGIDLKLKLEDETGGGFDKNEQLRLDKVKSSIESDVVRLFEFANNGNVDIFKIKENLNKYHYLKYKELIAQGGKVKTNLVLDVNLKSSEVR